MIVLDTHVWIWWMTGDARLTAKHADAIAQHATGDIMLSSFSCWELAMLAKRDRVELAIDPERWLTKALTHPAVTVVALTPRIVVESVQLPGVFHRDPADQLIVATARVLDCPLLTLDAKILAYPHVQLL